LRPRPRDDDDDDDGEKKNLRKREEIPSRQVEETFGVSPAGDE
jgi:hypothetical protein